MYIVKKSLNLVFLPIIVLTVFQGCQLRDKLLGYDYSGNRAEEVFVPKYICNSYKGQSGIKKCNDLPWVKEKAQQEAERIKLLEMIDKLSVTNEKKITALVDDSESMIGNKIKSLKNEILKLKTEINSTEEYSEFLKLGLEIEKLYCKDQLFKNSQIKKLESDYSFKTGSAELTIFGKRNITNFMNKLHQEVANWKSDIKCGTAISKAQFSAVIDIFGYADTQGSSDLVKRRRNNMELSERRAESVRKELLYQIRNETQIRFVINPYGKGESLPPGIFDNAEDDDPRRRISIMSGIVGPRLLVDDL
jgi:outer membrane protein OmpA-like peptidoglycan-associated protein